MQKTNYYKKAFARFPLDAVFIGRFYDGVIQRKLRRFKFVYNTVDTVYFKSIFADIIKESGIKNTPGIVIVYPPISLKDRIFRGPNHAKRLAKIFASMLGSESVFCPFHKVFFAGHQSRRNKTERKKILHELSFKDVFKDAIAGKEVIIVDDVISTGYTMYTLGNFLKNIGTKKIVGCFLASQKI